jgi:hypothetical protein
MATVISVQMARLERGFPIWSFLQFAGGIMMTIFLALPPLCWGIAAYSPDRPAEVTRLIHEAGALTFVITNQYITFQFVALAVVSITQKVDLNSAFPRWYGFFTLWALMMFEVGPAGFIPKTGPFAWNGLFVLWVPLAIFSIWIPATIYLILRSLRSQSIPNETPS